ncbi:PTS sugar transporter subunit IIA [Cedecea neteri]|uniref:PTS sugar transporter subunit IIA n=1 Tax=Cedecea neteri TaxID=158822 RepID=UPI0028936A07|nr:PTS sugar transporter subunit IIA [Cedecea neteri]WNJ82133.1 PTS sugar transporter subunit IIA [Cedecea neteri]
MKFEILVNNVGQEIATWEQAITFAGNQLLERGYIQPEYIAACLTREKSYPTGLMMANGEGLAIPHADYQLVNTNSISIVRFAKPVAFGQMEDADLTVECGALFNLAFATSDQHMAILRRLFTLFQEVEFVSRCRTLDEQATVVFIKQQLNIE